MLLSFRSQLLSMFAMLLALSTAGSNAAKIMLAADNDKLCTDSKALSCDIVRRRVHYRMLKLLTAIHRSIQAFSNAVSAYIRSTLPHFDLFSVRLTNILSKIHVG